MDNDRVSPLPHDFFGVFWPPGCKSFHIHPPKPPPNSEAQTQVKTEVIEDAEVTNKVVKGMWVSGGLKVGNAQEMGS